MPQLSLDEFVSHKSNERGASASRKSLIWKKRAPIPPAKLPGLTAWLHTQASIEAVWRHPWARLVERERDGEQTREVWSDEFVCHESEAVLRRQYRRGDDGKRVAPPEVCPLCRVIDYVHGQVTDGSLDWTDPVFVFDADEPRVFTAGGICNMFGRDLTADQKRELRAAKINLREAFKQNVIAKCSYIFTVVDHDRPEDGVQVCVEPTSLGDSVKGVIRMQMEGAEDERQGNPLINPYAIRWEYDENEPEFGKKYRAFAYPRARLTDEVRALIVDSPAPSLAAWTTPGDVDRLRLSMEAAAKIDLPFDRLFGGGKRAVSAQVPRERAAQKAPVKARVLDEVAESPPKPAGRRRAQAPTMIPCEACGKPMDERATKCPHCGEEYAFDDDPAPKPAAAAPAKAAKAPVLLDDLAADDDDSLPWG